MSAVSISHSKEATRERAGVVPCTGTMYYDDANDVDYEGDDHHAFVTTDEHGQSVGPMGITTKIPPAFDGRASCPPTRSCTRCE